MPSENSARPLRVVHVTQGLEMGGQEKLLVEFARHADRRGVDLSFLSLSTPGPLSAEIEACGWPVQALGLGPGLFPGLVSRLARLFRRQRPDVVHTHNNRPLIYAAPAARVAGVGRIVHTQHGRGFGVTRRQTVLTRWAARLARPFVCVSKDSAAWMIENGIPETRIQVLWNGIDLARFAFTGPDPNGPALIVARLSPEKDLTTLLRAAALVTRFDPGFRLDIAGDGPCRGDLQALAQVLGIEENVRFLGLVQDIPTLLSRASLFVLSSITEGVSLTLLEAMARGLPVVATRVGGNPEVVSDGVTGMLVPSGDPDALATAILRLRRDSSLARQMGFAGRARVERDFDIRAMVASYEALYAGQAFLPAGLSTGSQTDNTPKSKREAHLVNPGFSLEATSCTPLPPASLTWPVQLRYRRGEWGRG